MKSDRQFMSYVIYSFTWMSKSFYLWTIRPISIFKTVLKYVQHFITTPSYGLLLLGANFLFVNRQSLRINAPRVPQTLNCVIIHLKKHPFIAVSFGKIALGCHSEKESVVFQFLLSFSYCYNFGQFYRCFK